MPSGREKNPEDWTSGPAKWAAVIVLGVSSLIGMGWSMFRPSMAKPTAIEAQATPPPDAPAIVQAKTPPPIQPPPIQPPPAKAATDAAYSHKINLNTASAAELELLPGVGPAMAQRIIDHRTAHGPFKRVEDLDEVKGIGPRTLEKLRDLVTTK